MAVLSDHTYIDKQIRNYRLLESIRSSPICTVYRAAHVHLPQRTIVIKIFHTPPPSQPQRQQFLYETQLLSELKHPHILPIVDGGFYENIPYIVTDYLPNGSLRSRLQARSPHLLPLQESISILNQVAQALQYAHQQNMLHCNLKPENILFTSENTVMLADFRQNALLDATEPELSYHESSWPYLAPEQFLGTSTSDSDQYALACIAYELLTGRVPFVSSTFSTLQHKHLTENPLAPTHLNLLLPFPVSEVILKALAKKDRYPSIKDFISALNLSLPAHTSTPKLSPVEVTSSSTAPSFMQQDKQSTNVSKETVLPKKNGSEGPVYAHRIVQPPAPVPTVAASPALPPAYIAYTDHRQLASLVHSAQASTALPKHLQDLGRMLADPLAPPDESSSFPAADQSLPQLPTSIEPPTATDTPPSAPETAFLLSNADTQPQPPLAQELPASKLAVEPGFDRENSHPVAVPYSDVSSQAQPPLRVTKEVAADALTSADIKPQPLRNNQLKHTSHHFSPRAWLIIGGAWLIVIALIFSLVHSLWPVFSATSLPMPTPTASTVHHSAPTPTATPIATLAPTPVPTDNPAPSRLPTATPTPTPTPLVTPSPTPTPQPTSTLTVTPARLQAADCLQNGSYYFCTLLLQLPSTHQGNLRWVVSSNDVNASVVPARGMLSPGEQQSVNVYILTSCSHTGTLIILSREGQISVPWTC